MRSHELLLCTLEEIKTNLKKQQVKDVKRITIKKKMVHLLKPTHILTFNSPVIPRDIRIGYSIAKVENYIPMPLRCYQCHDTDTTKKLVLEIQCVEDVEIQRLNIQKIAGKDLGVQTAKRSTLQAKENVNYGRKKRKSTKQNIHEISLSSKQEKLLKYRHPQ